eukprot:21766-Prorocentrum_minimum.AAC.5
MDKAVRKGEGKLGVLSVPLPLLAQEDPGAHIHGLSPPEDVVKPPRDERGLHHGSQIGGHQPHPLAAQLVRRALHHRPHPGEPQGGEVDLAARRLPGASLPSMSCEANRIDELRVASCK